MEELGEPLFRLYRGEFKWFHPFDGEIDPEVFSGSLAEVASRCRHLLKNRSVEDIEEIAIFTDIGLSGLVGEAKLFGVDEINNLPDRFLVEFVIRVTSGFSRSDDPFLMSPQEILATQSLIFVAQAAACAAKNDKNLHWAASLAMEAAGFIGAAESRVIMASSDPQPEIASKVRTDGALKAASARWKSMAEVRSYAKQLAESGAWKSRADCARRIKDKVQQYAKDRGLALSEQNAERTITSWIKDAT